MSRMTWAEVDSLIKSSMNAYGDSATKAKAHELLRKEWTQLTVQADERDGLREMLLSQAERLAQAEIDARMLDTVRRRASSAEYTLADASDLHAAAIDALTSIQAHLNAWKSVIGATESPERDAHQALQDILDRYAAGRAA